MDDVSFAFHTHLKYIKKHQNEVILHVECGNGKVADEIIKPFFSCCKRLIGVETLEQERNYAVLYYSSDLLEFHNLDITHVENVENFRRSKEPFSKVFVLSCFSWMRNPATTLENIKHLMAPGGQCFFAFIASSPAYDIYDLLADNPKWAKYMEDYRSYVPFTHYEQHPHDAFEVYLKNAGFEVERCDVSEKRCFISSEEALNSHISATNTFLPRVPPENKRKFLSECAEALLNMYTSNIMYYHLVVCLARKPTEDATQINKS